MKKAHKAEVQMRALAYINVITLLDEAVEFKKNRPRYVLANILEEFVEKKFAFS